MTSLKAFAVLGGPVPAWSRNSSASRFEMNFLTAQGDLFVIVKSSGVGVMVTKQLSIAIAISICIGSGIAFKTFAAPASGTRIDFDQAFADATQQSQSQYVNRAHKSNRLNVKSVLQETALLPHCEPLASAYADPILGSIVGRCDA